MIKKIGSPDIVSQRELFIKLNEVIDVVNSNDKRISIINGANVNDLAYIDSLKPCDHKWVVKEKQDYSFPYDVFKEVTVCEICGEEK